MAYDKNTSSPQRCYLLICKNRKHNGIHLGTYSYFDYVAPYAQKLVKHEFMTFCYNNFFCNPRIPTKPVGFDVKRF